MLASSAAVPSIRASRERASAASESRSLADRPSWAMLSERYASPESSESCSAFASRLASSASSWSSPGLRSAASISWTR
ncbi:MAG: hypothetical protein P8Z40_15020 [Chloroflexota bacterium]